MKRPNNLTMKLKTVDPELRSYVVALEKENLKLHQRIAKFQVKDVSQQNEISALKKAQPKTTIKIINYGDTKKDTK